MPISLATPLPFATLEITSHLSEDHSSNRPIQQGRLNEFFLSLNITDHHSSCLYFMSSIVHSKRKGLCFWSYIWSSFHFGIQQKPEIVEARRIVDLLTCN